MDSTMIRKRAACVCVQMLCHRQLTAVTLHCTVRSEWVGSELTDLLITLLLCV